MQRPVPNQRAREQTNLAKNLEPIANADDQRPISRRVHHALHDGGKPGDGAAAKIIAVGKTTRQHDRVETIHRRFLVPDVFSAQPRKAVQRRQAILIAIGSWKLNDCEFHFVLSRPSTWKSSITGFESKSRQRSFSRASRFATLSSISISRNFPIRTERTSGIPRCCIASRTAAP